MKRFICLQAGHQNAKNNCDTNLRSSTGAPGEAEFTIRIRDAVSAKLQQKKNADGTPAFAVQLVDSTFNCDPTADNNDFALFLALHCDAFINGSFGGFADFPEPSTDSATKESQRIAAVFNDEYFKHSGIQKVNRSNANTRYYYMWKFLSLKTPCVLLECGTGQNPHDKVILADTEIVANAIVRAICKAFDVPYDTANPTPPTPTPPATDYKKLYEDEVASHQAYRNKFNQSTQDAAVTSAIQNLNKKIDDAQK